jgi:hypothetical protein
MTIISGFGMSETTFGLAEAPMGERRPGSMGKPRNHPDPDVQRTEAWIADSAGHDVPPRYPRGAPAPQRGNDKGLLQQACRDG